jgi:hypothetical protein
MGVVAAITFFWPNKPNPAIAANAGVCSQNIVALKYHFILSMS